MAEPKKRGCLGCSFPVLIIVSVIVLGITVVGFLAGPIGHSLFPGVSLPEWIQVPRPEPHLPAPVLFEIFGLPITNTVLGGWVTLVFLCLLSYLVTRRMKVVPGRLQSIFELIVGWLYNFCRSIAGEENGRRFFPLVASIFLFVAFNSWLSLIPGFGSIEIGGHELLRGSNTDINTPLALALISFVAVLAFGIQSVGVGYLQVYLNFGQFFRGLKELFRGKVKAGMNGIFLGAIDVFVGALEFLSHAIRILSFTFRLFGNMTAGEILLLIAAFLVPWIFAIPFYGLELLVGFVQALIFAGLTLVFLTIAVTPHHAE